MLLPIVKRVPGYIWLYNYLYRHFAKKQTNPFLRFAPPGHFYSPIPDIGFVTAHQSALFERNVREVPGVDVNEREQLELLSNFAQYYNEIPWGAEKKNGLRYYFDNAYFLYGDAIVLYSIIRHYKPRRIVEIGSGYSSAAMLDTNDLFFNNSIEFTFVEPYPDRLYSILSEDDNLSVEIIEDVIQSVSIGKVTDLEEGDVLFVDSSHVAKIGSDVIHLLSYVLPSLKKGVIIHFHDVFWPFEYPQEWLTSGRAWNEDYFLKAFLQFNDTFKVIFFNSFLATFHLKELKTYLPLFAMNTGGSIWIRKIS